MVSARCKKIVSDELEVLGIKHHVVELGTVELLDKINEIQRAQLKESLLNAGFELLDDKKRILVEKIKGVIIEMIHYTEELPKTNYSEYISEKLNYDYTYLSNIFTEVKGITIRQFIILHKIERVKELLLYEELNLAEISYKLHYSSNAHLSNQFKKVTGLSPSYYKKIRDQRTALLKNQ